MPRSTSDSSVEAVDEFLEVRNEVEDFIPVEYKVIDMANASGEELEEVFNALGGDGWDLVAWEGTESGRAIFSRS